MKPRSIKPEAPAGKSLMTLALSIVAALMCVSGVVAQDMSGHHHATADASNNPEAIQEWAKQRLAKSPRHQEWVKIKSGNREVNSFVVYPEVNKKATAVVVIHEIFGMSDWVQQLTDELAEAGYIAIAPDLLSGMGPKGGGTSDFDANSVRQGIGALPPQRRRTCAPSRSRSASASSGFCTFRTASASQGAPSVAPAPIR
jgi:hypothetical protein